MKITRAEFQLWLNDKTNENNFNWMHINTSLCNKLSDKDLLGMISRLKPLRGFGLIAELCKRFNESN